ncbi:MAG: hypothetical protein ACR2LM_01075 [Pyrinomonadaceae bacterium]
MAIDVYVLRNGQRHGPYALETVRDGCLMEHSNLTIKHGMPASMAGCHCILSRLVLISIVAVLVGLSNTYVV